MDSKLSQLSGLLYLLLHAYINVPEEETDDLPEDLLEWSFAYHILHPDGRGVDVQCLLTGGNYMTCLQNMPDARNREMLQRIYTDFQLFIWSFVLLGTDIEPEDMEWYIDAKIVPMSDEYRRPEDVLTDKILRETPPLHAVWQPTEQQKFLLSYMPRDE